MSSHNDDFLSFQVEGGEYSDDRYEGYDDEALLMIHAIQRGIKAKGVEYVLSEQFNEVCSLLGTDPDIMKIGAFQILSNAQPKRAKIKPREAFDFDNWRRAEGI